MVDALHRTDVLNLMVSPIGASILGLPKATVRALFLSCWFQRDMGSLKANDMAEDVGFIVQSMVGPVTSGYE